MAIPTHLHYTAWHLMTASTTQPLPQSHRAHHLGGLRLALDHIVNSHTPSIDDWRLLSDCVNHLQSLCEMGETEDRSGAIRDAVAAMANAADHYARFKVIRLRDENIARLQHLLDDYTELVNTLPARTMIACHMHTQRRVSKALRGKVRKGDVVVAL